MDQPDRDKKGPQVPIKSLFEATLYDINLLIENMQTKVSGTVGPCYKNMAEEWRKMNINKIFYRPYAEDALQFTSVLFLAAKVNLLPPTEIERQLYGLLVLHGLYTQQLCQKMCRIPVAHKEWNHLMTLYQYCATNDHKEQCFIFENLWSQDAFEFVFSPIDLSVLLSKHRYVDDLRAVAREAIMPQAEVDALAQDTNAVLKEFDFSKIAELQGKYNELTTGINGIEGSNLVEGLQDVMDIVPKKYPQYANFVRANRLKVMQEHAQNVVLGIGQRRRQLINRPVSNHTTKDQHPSGSSRAIQKYEMKVDPEYAFIHTQNSKHQAILMEKRLKQLMKMQAVQGEKQEHSVSMDIESDAFNTEQPPNQDIVMQGDESEPLPAGGSEDPALKKALSMPVVQWNDA